MCSLMSYSAQPLGVLDVSDGHLVASENLLYIIQRILHLTGLI